MSDARSASRPSQQPYLPLRGFETPWSFLREQRCLVSGAWGQVKRTLANLSQWEPQLVEHFRVLLKGGVAVESAASLLTIERSLPHGHVAAVLGACRT